MFTPEGFIIKERNAYPCERQCIRKKDGNYVQPLAGGNTFATVINDFLYSFSTVILYLAMLFLMKG